VNVFPIRFHQRLALALWLAAGAASAQEQRYNDDVLFPISVKEKHGAINRLGEVVIAPEYEQPVVMREGLARVRKGSRVAYLDASGKRVIEPQDMTDALFSQNRAPARGTDEKGKFAWGYLDRTGRWAILPRFADAREFAGGRAAVGVADEWGKVKYGYIDAVGTLVIQARYDKAMPFGRVARVEIEGRPRLIDAAGRDVTPPADLFFASEAGGMMLARRGKLFGYLDDEGRLAIEPRFEGAYDFKDGMARIWQQGKYGYVDKRGTLAVPAVYDSAADFSEGLAGVRSGAKYGFVDRAGKLAIPAQFDRVQRFSDGLAAAQQDKLWGYIDREGRWVITPRYQWVRDFRNGLAWAGEPRQRGGSYIDKQGKAVWSSPAD